MKATLVREYTHPDKQYADAAGNMQVLPNGNVFVGWGRALAISVVTPMPTEWWFRPVISACRVGEHSGVTWNRV